MTPSLSFAVIAGPTQNRHIQDSSLVFVLPDTVRTGNGRPMPSARRSSRRSTRRVVVDLLGFAND